jgi:hypothetical protein
LRLFSDDLLFSWANPQRYGIAPVLAAGAVLII